MARFTRWFLSAHRPGAVLCLTLGLLLTPVRPLLAEDLSSPRQAGIDYGTLQLKIAYSQATVAEVRKALTDTDPFSLSNTLHALFAMRWQRGVVYLLNDLWAMEREKYPELAWNLIGEAPARIALASTINRIRIVNTDEFKNYIRQYKDDEHEFIRAQVAIALGFNGDPLDLPYLQAMCNAENHYVAQAAITALSVFGGEQAKQLLITLAERHKGTARGDLMKQLLRTAYKWTGPEQEMSGR